MWLPTQAQVNTAGRYAIAVAGPVIALLGLQAKGFTLDQAKAVIAALGETVNSIVILLGALGAAYAAVKGVVNTSPSAQIAAVAEIAKDPDSPVKGIVTSNSAEGKALANSIPGATVASAGTVAADNLVKTGT